MHKLLIKVKRLKVKNGSLEHKLDSLQISALEKEIKRINHKVELLTKIYRYFEQGYRIIHSVFKQGDRVKLSDDDTDREMKITKVTAKTGAFTPI